MSLPGGMREHTKLTSFLLVICKKGHLITRFAEELPDEIKFCEICSEEIFRGCPKCDTPLISTEVVSHTHDFHYCGQCGEIFSVVRKKLQGK